MAATRGNARLAVVVEVVAGAIAPAGALLLGAHHAHAGGPLRAARAAVSAGRHHVARVGLTLTIGRPSGAVGPLVLAALRPLIHAELPLQAALGLVLRVDEPSKLELPLRAGGEHGDEHRSARPLTGCRSDELNDSRTGGGFGGSVSKQWSPSKVPATRFAPCWQRITGCY